MAIAAALGFRIGDFAYSTDVNGFPDASWDVLKGVKTWVVDCLRYTESYTHARYEQTLEWIAKLQPERAILTHMAHELDYEILCRDLPPHIEPGYDGMRISITP